MPHRRPLRTGASAAPSAAAAGLRVAAGGLWRGSVHWLLRLLVVIAVAGRASVASAQDLLSRIGDIYLELSTGLSLPLQWSSRVLVYSLAFPNDATKVAVRVVASQSDEQDLSGSTVSGAVGSSRVAGENQGEAEDSSTSGGILLQVPGEGLQMPLTEGEASALIAVSTEEATLMQLRIEENVYSISVIRSRLPASGVAEGADVARTTPPQGTLSGLSVWDSLGKPAQMAWFQPRRSNYLASVSRGAWDVQLAATPNDPGAELMWRRNGGKWDYLVSGLSSVPVVVGAIGWTLLDVRVRSATVRALQSDAEPLVYQISLTREVICHPKCRTCRGPGPDDCLSCFAPLSLRGGQCLYTACAGLHTYFDDVVSRCRPCHASCVSCEGGQRWKCTTCPSLRFLATPSAADAAGQCVAACPIGYFVQPTNQRCQRARTSKQVVRLYIKLALRVTLDDFLREIGLPQLLLRIASQTLAVSPQDVRFLKWEAGDMNLSVNYYLDVENPFMDPADVQAITIDKWFAAMPIPVDQVRVMSHSELYPPPRPEKVESFMQPWMWGLIAAGVTSAIVIYPMYHYYFIKMHFRKVNYKPKQNRKVEFVQTILDQAPDTAMRMVSREGGDR
eukprot:TRINITY_DN30274_c0_g1_i1.p1 TRINITY_DN30274_c0_g1~~TRINITY_DN30274_c0_g1_i1.p1  ORF type:complete len:618 (+),score=145.12 TRINITY_DN30274_c0_g1_i1:130-1983(+)